MLARAQRLGPVLLFHLCVTATLKRPVEKPVSSHFNEKSTVHHWQLCMPQPSAERFSPIVFFPPLSFSSGQEQGSFRRVFKRKQRIKSTFTACELDFQLNALLRNKPYNHPREDVKIGSKAMQSLMVNVSFAVTLYFNTYYYT